MKYWIEMGDWRGRECIEYHVWEWEDWRVGDEVKE